MRAALALLVLVAAASGCAEDGSCRRDPTPASALIAFPAEPSAWPDDAALRDALAAAGWTLSNPRDASPLATKPRADGLDLTATRSSAETANGPGLLVLAGPGTLRSTPEEARALLAADVEPLAAALSERAGGAFAAAYRAGSEHCGEV